MEDFLEGFTLPEDISDEQRALLNARMADADIVMLAVAAEIYLHPLKRRKIALDMMKRTRKGHH